MQRKVQFEGKCEWGNVVLAQVDFMGPNQFKSANNFRRANSASSALKSAKAATEKTKAEEEQSQADIALLNQTCDKLSLVRLGQRPGVISLERLCIR